MSNVSFKQLEHAKTGDTFALDDVIASLKLTDDGLLPCIAQQHDTGEVLMMAWMNAASLRETLETGQMCYWSRSRQTYWRKGESSGNRQRLVAMSLDCDGDTLLAQVDQTGAACHTYRRDCFYISLDAKQATITCDHG